MKTKINNWELGKIHKMYGKVVMMRVIQGEPYRFFQEGHSISMIPLEVLQNDKSI